MYLLGAFDYCKYCKYTAFSRTAFIGHCKTGEVQTEMHFLLTCTKYLQIRIFFFFFYQKLSQIINDFNDFSEDVQEKCPILLGEGPTAPIVSAFHNLWDSEWPPTIKQKTMYILTDWLFFLLYIIHMHALAMKYINANKAIWMKLIWLQQRFVWSVIACRCLALVVGTHTVVTWQTLVGESHPNLDTSCVPLLWTLVHSRLRTPQQTDIIL